MIELKKEEWEKLQSSVGGNGLLALELLQKIKNGDISSFDELLHQACHQLTVGEVAYAIVPHLVEIAKNEDSSIKLKALMIIGAVSASIGIKSFSYKASKLPAYLESDFAEANQEALKIACDALVLIKYINRDSLELLGVIAALSGHPNSAIQAFTAGYDSMMSCPECGEYINYYEST